VKGLSSYYIGKKERIVLRQGFLVYKVSGSSFPSGGYKELATFPNGWEVWKRLLQSVVSS
jgi:hypothetical protein